MALRTGKKYWRAKLAGNKARDRVVNRMLRRHGWRVVRIWEHELGEDSRQESEVRRQNVAGKKVQPFHPESFRGRSVRSQKTGDSGLGTRDFRLKAVERIRTILRRAQNDTIMCRYS